jgi:SOS-response transcriptional repressor LexA
MSNLAERLFRISKRHATLTSKGKLAEHLGISRSMLNLYEKGTPQPPQEFLDKVARLEVTLGIDDSTFVQEERPPDVRSIPVVGWAHAGEAASYDELPFDWQKRVPTECRDTQAFAVILEGESMEPKYSPGDMLILQPGCEPYSGCLAVCRFKDDGVVFRRVEFLPDAIRLIALNSAYPTTAYPRDAFSWIYPLWGRWTQVWK